MDASRPGYRQVAARLREQILGGELPPGARLTAHSDLARDIGVSQATISAAVSQLADEGLVRVEHGKPTVVLEQHRWHATVSVPWRGAGAAPSGAAEQARAAIAAAKDADPAVERITATVTLVPSLPAVPGGWVLLAEATVLASDLAIAVGRAWAVVSAGLRGQRGWDLDRPSGAARPA